MFFAVYVNKDNPIRGMTLSNADDRQYITRMHELVPGQRPNQDQLNYWLNRMAHYNSLRSEVVREFLADNKIRR